MIRATTNGRQPGIFEEVGTTGIETYAGYIQRAYHAQVRWPTCEPLYSRIWRSDPETVIVRQLFSALAGKLRLHWELPPDVEEPSEIDQRALDFAESVLADIDGGVGQWIESAITRVPFFGFGIWERVAGLRRPNWQAPDKLDTWRSSYDDGLVGVRRLAWRDYSAFERWEMDDASGRALGMWQLDIPNPGVLLPMDRLLHVTYGDHDNPEGLATLEAMWRLERVLYNMEIVQGIGFEHTAGHLSVTVEEGDYDEAQVKRAARAILTAQEGNYAAWPKGTKGEIIDSTFSAAQSLEEAIQNRRILKLALFGMQFVAISTMSGAGSYAALDDSSSLAMLIFNSIAEGIVRQADDQLGRWLFAQPTNAAAFAGMTARPMLKVEGISKAIALPELAQFATAMKAVMPLGDDDIIAVRRASGILPEQLPPEDDMPEQPEPIAQPEPDEQPEIPEGDQEQPAAEMAVPEPFVPRGQATIIETDRPITREDIDSAVAAFEAWAAVNVPGLASILRAEVDEPDASA